MRVVVLAFLLALVGPAAAVLLQPFFFASGDGPFHLFRLVEYESLWRQGILYPRWAPDFYYGYGYPIFNYYAPLTYYAALPFLLLGADPIVAAKMVALLSLVISAAGAYLYARLYASRAAAAVCAAAFAYAPYHLVTLYYRGDLAESLGMAWYPLILWSVTRVMERRRPQDALWLVLSLGGLVLSHNLSAFLFAPVLACYVVAKLAARVFVPEYGLASWTGGQVLDTGASPTLPPWRTEPSATTVRGLGECAVTKDLSPRTDPGGGRAPALRDPLIDQERMAAEQSTEHSTTAHRDHSSQPSLASSAAIVRAVVAVLGCAVAAAGLTAFFWLPAAAETSLISMQRLVEKIDYHTHFVGLTDLLSLSPVQRYGSVFNADDALNHQLALWQSLLLVLGIVLLVVRWRALGQRWRVETIFHLVIAGGALFLVTPASSWVWDRMPVLSLVQFPWRFLGFAALPVGVLGALSVESVRTRWRPAAASVVIAAVVAASLLLLQPTQVSTRADALVPDETLRYELTYGVIGTSIAGEYLPNGVANPPVSSPLALNRLLDRDVLAVRSTSNPSTRVVEESRRDYDRAYKVSAPVETTLTLNLLYFPGWEARLDGLPLPLAAEKREGLAQVTVPPGEHLLTVSFGETPLRLAADLISVMFALGLGGWLIWRGVRSRKRDREEIGAVRDDAEALPMQIDNRSDRRLTSPAIWLAGVILLILTTVGLKLAQDRYYAIPSDIPYPTLVEFPSATLLGYALEREERRANGQTEAISGVPRSVRLYWQQTGAESPGRVFARITGRDQQTWAYGEESWPGATNAGDGPIEVQLELKPDGPIPPGVYRVEAGLISGTDPAPIQRASVVELLPTVQAAQIGPLVVQQDSSSGAAILATDGQLANLENIMFLRKADVAAARAPWEPAGTVSGAIAVRAGGQLHVDALWQLSRSLSDDYTVTVRLSDDQGLLWTVKDILPSARSHPISLWPADAPVSDKLDMNIPNDTPPGLYRLQLEVLGPDHPLSVLGPDGTPMGPTIALGHVQVEPASLVGQTAPHAVAGSRGPERDLILIQKHLGAIEVQQGDRLHVDLRWLSPKSPNRDLDLRLILEGPDHSRALDETMPLVAQYPTSRWRAGEIVRGQYLLNLSARTPVGPATLRAQVIAHDSQQVLQEETLGTVQVKDRPRIFQASPRFPREEAFGGRVRLIGFDLPGPTTRMPDEDILVNTIRGGPGAALDLTLYWQAVEEMGTSYKVFVQLLDPSGRLVAQHDAPPRDGQMPTTGWQIDEVVTDPHRVELPASLPAQRYTVIVGLYDPANGARLTLPDGSDFVQLLQVDVTGGTQ